jgi:EAL and modified HD-GYP domain-containing signal transduction protein
MGHTRIARQPIYDRHMKVFGYELLYRSGNPAGVVDGDSATSSVLGSAFSDLGIEQLVGDKVAFVNFTRNLLLGDSLDKLPPEVLVVEVLEDIEPDEEVVRAVRRLSELGYTIALDDFCFREELVPLLEVADIVKVDIAPLTEAELRQNVEELRRWPVQLLAEKVETPEEFEFCCTLGFDYFQGYFFCRPREVVRRRPTGNRQALLQLMGLLLDPASGFQELSELAEQDPSLTYRLLRLVNSAHFSLPRDIDSVRKAMLFLGVARLRTWISFLLVAGLDDKPDGLLTVSLTRARMCELLAAALGAPDTESHWTLGMLSTIDAFLDMEMAEVLSELPLTIEMNAALLAYTGPRGAVLRCVINQERGSWSLPHELPLSDEQVQDAYQEALAWAERAVAGMG